MLILGLSRLNVDRLTQGMPIKFDGRPFGFAGDVGIVFGETEDAIAEQLLVAIASVDN
jgi:hypothetical protein